MTKLRASELRESKKPKDLVKMVEEAKLELQQVTGGTASKVGKIRMARKNIARVLTVLNQKAREKMRDEIKNACNGHGLKRTPKQLRVKKTRAIRRAMTTEQKKKMTVKATQKARNFKLRQFAVRV